MAHYENQIEEKRMDSTELNKEIFEGAPLDAYEMGGEIDKEFINRIEVNYVEDEPKNDAVNNPKHYTNHPSGVECIQVTEHMGFNLGNAMKYIWRCDLKKDAIEDLKKARWYLDREINKRENG